MGEIILSIAIGGCLVVSGIILITALNREEKAWKAEEKKGGK